MTPVKPVTGRAYVRPMDTDQRIAQLEAENASLRRTLTAMAAMAQAATERPEPAED